MKRVLTVVLLVATLLVGCDGAEVTSSLVSSEEISIAEVSSEEMSSEEISSEEISSEETSSEEVSNEPEHTLLDFVMSDGFLDVQAASKVFKPIGANDSHLFVETKGIKGYEINGGVYWVDKETLCRLATVPCRGDGKIKSLDFQDCGSWSTSKEQPDVVPATLINDPLYMSMILPSERTCFLKSRVNASLLDVADDKWVNVMTIGAVYRNHDVEIPDDAEFTVCISDVNLAIRTANSQGWFKAVNVRVPTIPKKLYYLPWTLEHEIGQYNFSDSDNRIKYFNDHVEVKLTGADLNATDAKKLSDKVKECVLHFWGHKYVFNCKGSEVLGIASSFKIWVKEPEASEYLTVGIGADWRDSSQAPLQAFAGYKHAVTNEPRIVVGHNVPPSKWDEVVGDESEKIQKLIGME